MEFEVSNTMDTASPTDGVTVGCSIIVYGRSVLLLACLLQLNHSLLGLNVCERVFIDVLLHDLLFFRLFVLVLLVDQRVLNVRYGDAVLLQEPLLELL